MKIVIRTSFQLMAVFWIVSPLTFTVLRATGVFDFKHDYLIGAVLSLVSFVVMFLTYRSWE